MGLLKELFLCRGAIECFDNAAEIKNIFIQHNIYGVDTEKGAVDIARLRFWLSLIVDERTPHALPNMDFKIMQGNSLLESYEGIDLSEIANCASICKDMTSVRYIWEYREGADGNDFYPSRGNKTVARGHIALFQEFVTGSESDSVKILKIQSELKSCTMSI